LDGCAPQNPRCERTAPSHVGLRHRRLGDHGYLATPTGDRTWGSKI
jgi:hypothetical protein